MQELTKLKPMFTTISDLGQPPSVLLCYLLTLNLMPKPAALYFWCAMPFVLYLTAGLKSLYGEDRPYWVSDQIKSETCHLTFGNPSGHMLNNVFFWASLYLHAYSEVGVRQPRMSVFCTAYIIKMAATCVGICFLIFMGFSRVYLGAHTYNQVVFGSVLGLTLAFIGHFKVKPLFLSLQETLYSDAGGSKYAVTPMVYLRAFSVAILAPWLMAVAILLVSPMRAFHYSVEYKYRQTAAGCSADELTDEY